LSPAATAAVKDAERRAIDSARVGDRVCSAVEHFDAGRAADRSCVGAATNDAFTFIGTNTPFTGTAGQLDAFWSAIGQIIEGDVNGDAKPDFSIEIGDPTHAITLTSASFIL
jgi:hypothetical protein